MKIFKTLVFYLSLSACTWGQSLADEAVKLTNGNYDQKEAALKEMANTHQNDKNFLQLLNYLQQGKLYYHKLTQELFLLQEKKNEHYIVVHFLNSESSKPLKENLPKNQLVKVGINNKLRSIINDIKNDINLSSPDKAKRLQATKSLLEHLEADDSELIQKIILQEKDTDIQKILHEAKTNLQAKYSEGEKQWQAVQELGTFLSPKSVQTLQDIAANSTNSELQKRASLSLQEIERARKTYAFIETLFFGLSLGSVLLLAALGLAITFGVMKVINMAHGELIMIGAYTTYVIQIVFPKLIEYSVFIAVPAAFLVSAIFGLLIERLIIKHLYGRPLETLLATFGVSLLLQQLIRSIFSTLNQEVKTPAWMSGALEINDVLSFTYNRVYIVIFSFLVFFALLLIIKKTSLGLKVRAVSQNRQTARAMGVNSHRIDALTFALGSGIAGIAGVALSQLTNVGPNLGQDYIVDSFMVVVFGGVGNLWGTFIAALSLGQIHKFIEPLSGAVLAKVIILVFIILFIQKKPRGLFPQQGRENGE